MLVAWLARAGHIYTLRKALTQPGEAELIETVHGIGYRIVAGDIDSA